MKPYLKKILLLQFIYSLCFTVLPISQVHAQNAATERMAGFICEAQEFFSGSWAFAVGVIALVVSVGAYAFMPKGFGNIGAVLIAIALIMNAVTIVVSLSNTGGTAEGYCRENYNPVI